MGAADQLAAVEETVREVEARVTRYRRIKRVLDEEHLSYKLLGERFGMNARELNNALLWLKRYEAGALWKRRS